MKPTCKECSYMRVLGRAIHNGNNRGLKGPRAGCYCNHSRAIETFYRVCPRSPRTAGFIGFTYPGEDTPQTKTAPRWCPLKTEKYGDE